MTAEHDAAWAQLVADAKAFAVAHEGPEFVARLVWEAMVLGFVQGTQHAFGRVYDEQRADFPKDHAIVAQVMGYVTVDGVEHFAALRELALADFKAKRAEAALLEEAAERADAEGAR